MGFNKKAASKNSGNGTTGCCCSANPCHHQHQQVETSAATDGGAEQHSPSNGISTSVAQQNLLQNLSGQRLTPPDTPPHRVGNMSGSTPLGDCPGIGPRRSGGFSFGATPVRTAANNNMFGGNTGSMVGGGFGQPAAAAYPYQNQNHNLAFNINGGFGMGGGGFGGRTAAFGAPHPQVANNGGGFSFGDLEPAYHHRHGGGLNNIRQSQMPPAGTTTVIHGNVNNNNYHSRRPFRSRNRQPAAAPTFETQEKLQRDKDRHKLKRGTKVSCRFRSMYGNYYRATVQQCNADGTFQISYQDGDVDDNVMIERLQLGYTAANNRSAAVSKRKKKRQQVYKKSTSCSMWYFVAVFMLVCGLYVKSQYHTQVDGFALEDQKLTIDREVEDLSREISREIQDDKTKCQRHNDGTMFGFISRFMNKELTTSCLEFEKHLPGE